VIEEQLAAVRETAGWIQHRDRGLLRVGGSDRMAFLNGQLSNDIGALSPPDYCYTFVLTPQGRIVADLHVIAMAGEIWLETARERVRPVFERLDRFLVADDVTLEDQSAAWVRFGLEGPASGRILEAALGLAFPPDRRVAEVPPHWIAAFGWTGESAYQIFALPESAAELDERVRRVGAREGLVPLEPAALEVARVEAGIPATGREIDEQVLPAETGLLERAVSFTKGCYTGQEVVARMDSRGRVSHRLVGVRFGAAGAEPGARLISEGRVVGDVSSVVQSPRHGAIGLAYLRVALAVPGTELGLGGTDELARVAALPFAPE